MQIPSITDSIKLRMKLQELQRIHKQLSREREIQRLHSSLGNKMHFNMHSNRFL